MQSSQFIKYVMSICYTAVDVQSLPPARHHDTPPTVIVLDGTWAQAKGMYHHNPQFKRLTQIVLAGNTVSEYVIRTQPTHNCLSTLECVAHTLAWLEESPDIIEVSISHTPSHTHTPHPHTVSGETTTYTMSVPTGSRSSCTLEQGPS